MAEFRGQIESTIGALSARVEELARAVTDARAQHAEAHSRAGLNANNIAQVARDLAALKRTVDGLPTAPGTGASGGGVEKRKRLDRMVEIRGNISTYDGKTMGAGMREWADDMRDHVSGYDPKLGAAMAAVDNKSEAIDSLGIADYGVADDVDNALRRLVVAHTSGDAKKFHRTRPDAGGLELWRQMTSHFDPMTEMRAMADCGRLMRTPVAKDWQQLARLLAWYDDELMKFESRTRAENHLHDAFKKEAVWHMVPEREKISYAM